MLKSFRQQANPIVRINLRRYQIFDYLKTEAGWEIGSTGNLRPVFTSRKIIDDIEVVATKPSLINQQCVFIKITLNIHPDISFNASPNLNRLL